MPSPLDVPFSAVSAVNPIDLVFVVLGAIFVAFAFRICRQEDHRGQELDRLKIELKRAKRQRDDWRAIVLNVQRAVEATQRPVFDPPPVYSVHP